jgi:hypothetical protein
LQFQTPESAHDKKQKDEKTKGDAIIHDAVGRVEPRTKLDHENGVIFKFSLIVPNLMICVDT